MFNAPTTQLPLLPDFQKKHSFYKKLRISVCDVRWPHAQTNFDINLDDPEQLAALLPLIMTYNVVSRLVGERGAARQAFETDPADVASILDARLFAAATKIVEAAQ